MTKIYVDDRELEVKEGQNLLHAALSHGFDLPYFCWHPALGSVGACRQCAVVQYKDADDKIGRLVMSCMTPATEGTRISVACDTAKNFRASVIEWLMTNHPHDCPVCDEGGECHLQDMTVMSGHNYRDFRFKKRTFKNQNLGPFINHEMNRCITCYRCVRYYRDVAGGTDLNSFSSSSNVYFGRVEDGPLESEFSGNLVEICPTGVFTDKSFKQNYTRKWDLQVAPSVCQLCSLGCNITPGERGGILRRVQNRFHSEINGYFICDKGRFGHDYVNSKERILSPLYRPAKDLPQKEIGNDESLKIALEKLKSSSRVIGIGSPRASLESNFALKRLVGRENFYSSEGKKEYECVESVYQMMKNGMVEPLSLKDIEASDAIVILGEDITNTAPMMAFSVRQVLFKRAQEKAAEIKIPSWNDAAIRNLVREKTGPIYSLQVSRTKLDDISAVTKYVDPHQIAKISFAIAHFIHETAPLPNLNQEENEIARQLALVLQDANNPVLIAGTSLESKSIIEAVGNISLALKSQAKKCGVAFALPQVNSLGLHSLNPLALSEAEEGDKENNNTVSISLENERESPKASFNIVLDYINHKSLARADLVIPVASFAEGTGTLVNNEGRAQKYYSVMAKPQLKEAWKVLSSLEGQNERSHMVNIEVLTRKMCEDVEILQALSAKIYDSSVRICGQKIPRAPLEQSGRTSILANKTIHEPKPPTDEDSPYAFSMEGAKSAVPGSQTAVFWAPKWNSVQSLNKFQDEVGGPLTGGPTGIKLFVANNDRLGRFFDPSQASFESSGTSQIIWQRRIFRTKERDIHSTTLAQYPSNIVVGMSAKDSQEQMLAQGQLVEVNTPSGLKNIPCDIQSEIPQGWLIVPEELR